MHRAFTIFLISMLLSGTSMCCEYTVRDIGFVDLRGSEFTLLIVGPSALPAEASAKLERDHWNVDLAAARDSTATDIPIDIRKHLADSEAVWSAWLVDSHGDSLLLEQTELPEKPLQVEEIVADYLETPVLQKIRDGALQHFAQLIIFESPITDSSAQQVAQKASDAMESVEHLLPRPITAPIRLIVVSPDERSRERVLLWAMGFRGDNLESALAVVYGRGRLAGPAMAGKDIRFEETLSQLALVGESCECETDRGWLQAAVLPMSWPKSLGEDAVHYLGFEPASPMVRAEVRRIVSAGHSRTTASNEGSKDTILSLVHSYLEMEIAARAAGSSLSQPAVEGGAATPPVNATVIAGDGWSFDEDAAAVEPVPPTTEASPSPVVTESSTRTAEKVLNSDLGDTELSPARDPVVYMLAALSVVCLATLLGSATYLLVIKR